MNIIPLNGINEGEFNKFLFSLMYKLYSIQKLLKRN